MKRIIILTFIAISISSCSSLFYTPNVEVVEPLSEKGELQGSILFGHSGLPKYGVNVQYSPLQHIAVGTNIILGPRQKYFSVNAGVYNKITTKTFIDLHLYSGLGTGFELVNSFSSTSENLNISKYYKVGTQIGIHVVGKNIQWDNIMGASYLNFYQFEIFGDEISTTAAYYAKNNVKFLISNNQRLAFPFDFGKFYIGLVTDYTNENNKAPELFRSINGYFGASFELAKIFK